MGKNIGSGDYNTTRYGTSRAVTATELEGPAHRRNRMMQPNSTENVQNLTNNLQVKRV